ncbi:MAG: hypothetical protein ACREOO_24785 [bacterium]
MKKILIKSSMLALVLALIGVSASYVYSTTIVQRNLASLTKLARVIFVGKMISARDDMLNGRIPYTEYTFEVVEPIKGNLLTRSTFKYRQFGLLQPRDMGNGKRLALTGKNIAGLPLYQNGETVLVFLGQASPQSGLRTTVGLTQGKFSIENGMAVNELNNAGLFEGMNANSARLNNAEKALLSQKAGPLDAKILIATVKRAVEHQIFE